MKPPLSPLKTFALLLAVTGLALSVQAIPTRISGPTSSSGTSTIDDTRPVPGTRLTLIEDDSAGAPSALRGNHGRANAPSNLRGTVVSGIGTADIPGLDLDRVPSTGQRNVPGQTLGRSPFTIPSTTTIPAQPVSEGGSTIVLLGMSLLGLAWMGRRQILRKLQ